MPQVAAASSSVQKAQKVGPTPTLSFDGGPIAGERISLDQEITTFGRSDTNDCVLADPRISRVHAEIRQESGRFLLTDFGSRSGTTRNGQPVSGPTVIHHGDQIGFGPISASFEHLASGDEDEETMPFSSPQALDVPQLSPRQQEVLELMAEGNTNQQIAEVLGVTERTVKAYAHEMYDRLGVHNRAGAVAQGAKHGLI